MKEKENVKTEVENFFASLSFTFSIFLVVASRDNQIVPVDHLVIRPLRQRRADFLGFLSFDSLYIAGCVIG